MRVAETDCVDTAEGRVARVQAALDGSDRWGAFRVRLNVGRMRYAVKPGLYAVGSPGTDSPVLVSANYKLSFDSLRKELSGVDAWILALDTKGINVWCAAGKGTFGTHEVIKRVKGSGLERIVRHRSLILPQLGAPGVTAHAVTAMTGFRVQYGPVRASDLPEYLRNGRKKTEAMRRVEFPIIDRLKLIPVEMTQAWPVAAVAGVVLAPALLPWLPFRAFSLKGAIVGAIGLGAWWALSPWPLLKGLGILLSAAPLSAFLALNYTGASTFTSLSGVKREMKFAMPAMLAAETAGLALRAISAARGA